MKEIEGNLWDFFDKENFICCITTNGTIKKNGEAVMGRGCAKEAVDRFPDFPKRLGETLAESDETIGGNFLWRHFWKDGRSLITFPVKHNWYENADLNLILRSAEQLAGYANSCKELTFILPRPGCGNGGLTWEQVKPVIEDILPSNVWVISK